MLPLASLRNRVYVTYVTQYVRVGGNVSEQTKGCVFVAMVTLIGFALLTFSIVRDAVFGGL